MGNRIAKDGPVTLSSCLYFGQVRHARLRPIRHRFAYRVFSMLIDLDDLPRMQRGLRLFAHNRANLFSFHDRDHGPRDGGPLRPWIEEKLGDAGIDIAGGPIRIHCFPRVLGYVFNPLSVWFCYHRTGGLRAVLYEVRNTFGEAHSYLFPVDTDRAPDSPVRQSCDKRFYVSPFIGMEARYHFRLREPSDRLDLVIRQDVAEGENFIASHTGRRRPMTDAGLMRAFLTHPLVTLKVIAGIHWEALRLWRKRAPYHRRPAPPREAVTIVTDRHPEAAE